jgi:Leucine-rich repeat (LRR) protein
MKFSPLELILIIFGSVLAVLFIGVMIYVGVTASEPPEEPEPEVREGIVIIAEKEYDINLTTLTIQWTPLSRADVREIARMSNLTRLEIKMCEIDDISPLARLTRLERLDLRFNEISDLTPLSALTNLTHLNLSHNSITNVSALSELENLIMLDVGANLLTDISALYGLSGLQNLYIYDNARDPNNNNIPFLDEHTRGEEIRAKLPNTRIHF